MPPRTIFGRPSARRRSDYHPDRNKEPEAEAKFKECAGAAAGDTSMNKDVQQIVGTALSSYGRIDALHNNAGILRTFPSIEEHSEEVWRRVVDVNLTGYFLTSRASCP